MNELTTSILLILAGSLLSTLLFHALVEGFNWKANKAVFVAPFALVILPFAFLVVFPCIVIGELCQAIVRMFRNGGTPKRARLR